MVLVEDELFSDSVWIAGPLKVGGITQRSYKPLPMRFGAGTAGVEHQAHGHVELAHGVLRSFQVAAHPVEAVSNT